MAIYADSIGTLILNTSLLGAGALFGLLGIVMGIARGMTKNQEMWGVSFATFAWLIALIAPNQTWAVGMFIAGAVALTTIFASMMPSINENNIFVIATIAGILSVIMLIGSGTFTKSANWGYNLEQARTDVYGTLNVVKLNYIAETPNHQICQMGDNSCQNVAIQNSAYNPGFFDVIASVLAIGRYVSIAITFIGMAVLAPFLLTTVIAAYVMNPFIAILIGVYANMYNIVVLYHVIKFILNKRGM